MSETGTAKLLLALDGILGLGWLSVQAASVLVHLSWMKCSHSQPFVVTYCGARVRDGL